MYKSLYRRVSKKVLLKKTVDRIIYSANSVIIQSKDNETFIADYALCTLSTGVLASDRRLKGKGKGILGARETRGVARREGRKLRFLPSLLALPDPVFLSRLKLPFPSPPNACHAGYIKGQTGRRKRSRR